MASKTSIIFDKWKTELEFKDVRTDCAEANFDELFQEVFTAGADFDEAHAILNTAIKAHQPPLSVGKKVYRRLKTQVPFIANMTEREYIDSWNDKIAKIAKRVFYSYFYVEGDKKVPLEEKASNKKAKDEYNRQRQMVDAIPLVDIEAIKEKMPPLNKNLMEELNRTDK